MVANLDYSDQIAFLELGVLSGVIASLLYSRRGVRRRDEALGFYEGLLNDCQRKLREGSKKGVYGGL